MREYFLYEIDADEKPIFEKDEWLIVHGNLTREKTEGEHVVAYEKVSEIKVIPLYGSLP